MDKYEAFWRRVGAAILDSFIVIPVNWGVSFVVISASESPTMLVWAIPGFISALYYILMHYYRGQTLGKMIANVKVLDDSETPLSLKVLNDSETPLSLGQAIVRSLPQLLIPMFAVSFSTADESAADSIALWTGLIYVFTFVFSLLNVVVCLASSKRRALHDFLAGTIVVRTDV